MGYSAKIYQYKRIRKDGTAPLYLRVMLSRRDKLDIKLEDINVRAGRLIGQRINMNDSKLEGDYNLLLDKAKSKASDIFIRYRLADRQLTRELFMREWNNPDLRNDFITFMQQEAAQLEGMMQLSTRQTYFTTINHLKAFRPYIHFLELTDDFPEDLDRFLKKTQKLGPSSRAKQHKNVKKFIGIAIRRGVKITNPYRSFKIKQHKAERVYLTWPDVNRLVKIYYKKQLPDWLLEDLRKFLFSCFTGPRYSDCNQFDADNIIEDTLIYQPLKTIRFNKTIKVPLTKLAKQFLLDQDGRLFKHKEIQAYNRSLKLIADVAGIDKNITSHVARHTFATLFLEAGGKVETLQQLLGHADINTTMIYVHLTDKRKEREISLMDKLRKKKKP